VWQKQFQIENFKFQMDAKQSRAMERRRLNCGNELKACAGETAQAVARCAVFSSQTLRSGLNCVAPTALVSRVGEAHGCYGILCETNAKRFAVGDNYGCDDGERTNGEDAAREFERFAGG
jgi:hypothetical protein